MYRVGSDETSQEQFDALPPEGQRAWRELRATLELVPWILYYLVLEDQQRCSVAQFASLVLSDAVVVGESKRARRGFAVV